MAGRVRRSHRLVVNTPGRGLVRTMWPVGRRGAEQPLAEGLPTIWRTPASLRVQENADPNLLAELAGFRAGPVPDGGAARDRLGRSLRRMVSS